MGLQETSEIGKNMPRFRTVVDLNRGGVGIDEGIVQQWLHERPDIIHGEGLEPVRHWIGWQYRLPNGIADLIGMQAGGNLSLIEVKRLRIQRADISQVLRYVGGVEQMLKRPAVIDPILVGSGIGWAILEEARAAGVKVFSYHVIGNLGVCTGLTLQALWPEGILHYE